jgi:hypothetical protein
LINTLSKEVLTQVISKTTSHEAWSALENMFLSQSRSWINNLRIQLAKGSKGNLTVAAYFAKMTGFADELAAAGKPLAEYEVVSYILARLESDYNSLVAAIDAQKEEIALDDLYARLSNYDARNALLGEAGITEGFKSSANAAARGHGNYSYLLPWWTRNTAWRPWWSQWRLRESRRPPLQQQQSWWSQWWA